MNEKVLVIDDEEDYMQLMVRFLIKKGYKAAGTTSAEKALAAFKRHRGDVPVIVADWMMPDMSGNEFVLEAQKLDPTVQAVIITAFGEGLPPQTGIPGWGNFKHLNKPLTDMDELSNAVQLAIDFRKQLFNEKVLVIDDEEDYLQLMVRHLTKRGYTAFGTTSAKEGLEIFKSEGDIPVIITDWMMPDMSGNELIIAAQQIDPTVQAIIITGFFEGMETPTGIPGWGNFKHLDKPLANMNELSDTVRYALDFRKKLISEA